MRSEWKVPIEVQLGSMYSFQLIARIEHAAEALAYRWPVSGGAKWLNAMRKCLDALEGKTTDDIARKAFIAAAVDANVSVRPWQRNLPQASSVCSHRAKETPRKGLMRNPPHDHIIRLVARALVQQQSCHLAALETVWINQAVSTQNAMGF